MPATNEPDGSERGDMSKSKATANMVKVEVLMPREECEALKEVCDGMGLSVSDVARNALGWFADQAEEDMQDEIHDGTIVDCHRMAVEGFAPGYQSLRRRRADRRAKHEKAA